MARPKGSKDKKPRKPRSRKQEDATPPRVGADSAVPFRKPKNPNKPVVSNIAPLPTRPLLPLPNVLGITEIPRAPRGPGHPKVHTPELENEILSRFVTGESLRMICAEEGMPAIDTVWRWRWSIPGFSERYALARAQRADVQAMMIEELADEKPMTYVDEKGQERIDPAWASVQKLRIDSRKWIASKLVPRTFGDHITVDGEQKVTHTIDPETQGLLAARERALQRWKAQGHIGTQAPIEVNAEVSNG